jgi:chemotaxis regulatin CheY-phosphate phosphatase CheZ
MMANEKVMEVTNDQFTDKLRGELEKLTSSINEIMHNMRMMQNPIIESQEKLPQANEQLGKISQQTEQATHKMLDMVEQIIDHQEKVCNITKNIDKFFNRSRSKNKAMYKDQLSQIHEMATISHNNAFIIMDALQFQDITTQQMQHASTLLEDIESRLHHLLAAFEGKEIPDIDFSERRQGRAFDPNADLFNGKDQMEVDNIVSQTNEQK